MKLAIVLMLSLPCVVVAALHLLENNFQPTELR